MRFSYMLLGLLLSIQCFAVTLPYTFTTNVPPSQANGNFSALRDAINEHEALPNGHNTDLSDVLAVGTTVGSYSINFNNKELFSARVENVASDPSCSAGVKAKMIFNTVDGLLKVCDGSTFVSIAGTGVNTLASVLSAGNEASDDIDMDSNELLNARVENLGSDPSPGAIGRLIFNTVDSTLKVDTGAVIQAIGGAQGLASVLGVSNSAGSVNLDMNGNQILNLYVQKLSSDPGSSSAARVYYNTTSNILKFHDGTSWKSVGNTNTLAQTMALGNSTGSYDLDLNGNELLDVIIQNSLGNPSTGEPGRLWFETGTDTLQFGTSGANRIVATTDGTETLTNKTISGASNTLSNIPDAALSSNVVLRSGSQAISGTKTFSAAPVVSAIATPSGGSHTVTDGLANDTVTLNKAAQELEGKTLKAPSLSGHLDFNSYQAQEMRLENLGANPTNAAGRVYYNTNTGELRYGTGTEWRVLTNNLVGASIGYDDLSAISPLLYDDSIGEFSIDQSLLDEVWHKAGDAGTTAGTDFLGTTDSVDLVLKTDNTERLRILAAGGIDTPLSQGVAYLDSNGVLSSETSVTPTELSYLDATASIQDQFDELMDLAIEVEGIVDDLVGDVATALADSEDALDAINAATPLATPHTLVQRDGGGGFNADQIDAAQINVNTPTIFTGAANIRAIGDSLGYHLVLEATSSVNNLYINQRDNGDLFFYNSGLGFMPLAYAHSNRSLYTGNQGGMYRLEANYADGDTTPATPSSYSLLGMINTDGTAGNYNGIMFQGTGPAVKPYSGIFGIHEAHSATVPTGRLDFYTSNAGTFARQMSVAADGAVTFDAYSEGVLATDSSGEAVALTCDDDEVLIADSGEATGWKCGVAFGGVTQRWYKGHHAYNCAWIRGNTSGSFLSFPSDGDCSFSNDDHLNMASTVAGSATEPNIVFTPNETSAYRVCVSGPARKYNNSGRAVYRLYDATNSKELDRNLVAHGSPGSFQIVHPLKLCGLINGVASTPQTIEMQTETDDTYSEFGNGNTYAEAYGATWTIEKL